MNMAMDYAALSTVPQLAPAPKQDAAGLVKRVWLLLYAEGGRWTSAEIGQKRSLLIPPRTLPWLLREMVRSGCLVRFDGFTPEGTSLTQYGVGKRSKVPRGVTIEDLWDVLQMGGKS